jgi:hypothetical protein
MRQGCNVSFRRLRTRLARLLTKADIATATGSERRTTGFFATFAGGGQRGGLNCG